MQLVQLARCAKSWQAHEGTVAATVAGTAVEAAAMEVVMEVAMEAEQQQRAVRQHSSPAWR